MKRAIQLTIRNRKIECILEGKSDDFCLFFGPWEIYHDTFPEEIFSCFTIVGLDYHFIKKTDGPAKEETLSLTLKKIMEFYDEAFSQLHKEEGVKEIYLMAPSALGYPLLEYARLFPERIKGILLIGIPYHLENLPEKQNDFFNNYSPFLFPNLVTQMSLEKWQRNLDNQSKYLPILQDKRTSELDKYIAELKKDEEKYYVNRDLAAKTYEIWRKVNITIRNHSFNAFLRDYDPKILQEIKSPVLIVNGIEDGISPCYEFSDMIESGKLPANFSYYLVSDAAHLPHYEQPRIFMHAVHCWKEKINSTKSNIDIFSTHKLLQSKL